jgi:hypothetical protein
VDCNQHNKRSEAHEAKCAQLRRSAGARQFPGTE